MQLVIVGRRDDDGDGGKPCVNRVIASTNYVLGFYYWRGWMDGWMVADTPYLAPLVVAMANNILAPFFVLGDSK